MRCVLGRSPATLEPTSQFRQEPQGLSCSSGGNRSYRECEIVRDLNDRTELQDRSPPRDGAPARSSLPGRVSEGIADTVDHNGIERFALIGVSEILRETQDAPDLFEGQRRTRFWHRDDKDRRDAGACRWWSGAPSNVEDVLKQDLETESD
jgi:hypothetical protein